MMLLTQSRKKILSTILTKVKGKVVADNHIQNFCNKIANLSDKVKNLVSTNERLTSELSVVKNVNNILENKIVNLEKQLSKNEQYGRRNNVKRSGISNDISDQDLEENLARICKDSDINILPMDIEGCHRLPLERNSTNATEQVIVKFVNRNNSEAMLRWKKDINSTKERWDQPSFLSWSRCDDKSH